MKRWFFLLGCVFALSLLAQAGTMPTEVNGGKPVTLVVFGLPSLTNATAVGAKADMAVAAEFMKRYPNVTLKPFSFLKVPGAGMEGGSSIDTDTNTLMAMAAGIAPEVFTTNFRQSDTFIRQGFLLPLDKQIAEWQSTEEGRKEFANVFPYPVLKEVANRVGPDKQKHWYAVPPDTLSMVMMYRKDILSAAGLDPNKPPQTWDEFYDLCMKVTDPRKPVYGYTLQGSWFLSWMLWSEGNKIIDTKNNIDWYADYNSDEPDNNSIEAFKFAWKLVNGPWAICPECDAHYELPPASRESSKRAGITVSCPNGHKHTVAELNDKKLYFEGVCSKDFNLWGQSKMACMISYMGNMVLNTPGVDPSLILLARVPKSPMGLSVSEINAKMYAINGTLKDPGKIETAWAYIRFQCSDEAKKIKTKVFVDNGYAKYLNPAWLSKFGYEAYLREVPPQWEQMFNDALREGRPEPYGKNAQQIYNEMDVAWNEVQAVKVLDDAGVKEVKAILKRNVDLTNEKLMGDIPAPVKKKRDFVALIVVVVSAVLFLLLGRYTMATYGKALSSDAQRNRAAMRQVIMAWLIMVPALGAVLLFQYLPLARGSLIAFQDYQILLTHQKWVGLSNFGSVLFTPAFWEALGHTVFFAVLSLAMGFLAPVVLALLLHEIPRASLFFRIVFYLPAITSGVVVMLLWMQLYDASPYGALNQIILFIGNGLQAVLPFVKVEAQKFLQDPNMALFWVIIPSVWMGIGPGCIIYLAALRQIPTDYYEAADVDGAGFFAKLWTITIPYLKPLLIINFVGACVGAMKSFEQILIMTGGQYKTNVLGLELWRNAFMYLRYGHATAMGWILASLLIGFTMFQLRYLSKVQFRLAKSD